MIISAIWLIQLSLSAGDVFPVPALPYDPLSYVCFKGAEDIVIDGMLSEPDWQTTTWTSDFVDIEGSLKPLPTQQTRVKMLWNSRGLLIGAELMEKHIWAKLTERDAVIFYDNDFEVFIDPDGDTHDYYELEVNALGTLWDLFIIKPYRDRDQVAVNSWDIRNIEYRISTIGTINNPDDTDTKWIVEMLLPWNVLAECAHKSCPPPDGDYWRMNFSRVQWQTDIIDGQYVKKQGVPENNWVWSPQGLIAMHYPERWGFVFFSRQSPVASFEGYNIPPVETAKHYLREIYYKQKQYWFDHKKYATCLEKLDMKPFIYNGRECKLTIETTELSYLATQKGNEDFPTLHIREDGLTW